MSDFFTPQLYANLAIPSAVHGYSLAIEYMQNWFLKRFNDDFFKTIYINGKHVFDDYRKLTNQEKLKRLKPALTITPTLQFDYDRDRLDMYYGGIDMMIKRSKAQDAFLKDTDKNIYLGFNLQQLQLNFNFRLRVQTRAQQIDIYKYMELAYRVGLTQGEYIDLDFHIPRNILCIMAKDAGFEIKFNQTTKNNEIIDPVGFLQYLNAHSQLPILYKLRTINGNSEYFIKVPDCYIHIAIPDKLSADDGDREGFLDNNFNIEMNCVTQIPIPQFYVYYSKTKPQSQVPTLESSDNIIGIYTFQIAHVPEQNDKGWEQYLTTEYVSDVGEKQIDISALLEHHELRQVIDYTTSMHISSDIFVDFQLFNDGKHVSTKVDWEKMVLNVNEDIKGTSNIVIYVDLEYLNDQLKIINKLGDSRL